MAGTAMGMCLQVKGCARDVQHVLVAGGIENSDFTDWQFIWWTMAEWMAYSADDGIAGAMVILKWIIFYVMMAAGAIAMATTCLVLVSMVLVWWHPSFIRGYALRNAPWMMLIRFKLIKVPLWISWWFLKMEIKYLHDRFKEAHQSGDMCADFENLYNELDQYLTDGRFPVGASILPTPFPTPERDGPMVEPAWNPNEIFAEGADIGELALQYVRLHGRRGEQAWFRTYGGENEPRGTAEEEPNVMGEAEVEMEDAEEEEEGGESPETRDRRYRNSDQDEVSEPDHWSMLHYGHLAWDDHERMLSFSRANQIRLNRAIYNLQERRQAAEASGNWYEAAQITQAISEVESLRDIA